MEQPKDYNEDRSARAPKDIPHRELQSEIDAAVERLWSIGFKEQIGSALMQSMEARKARLLALIAKQAEEQTKRIVRLTWGLLVLTVILLIFTAVLAGLARSTDKTLDEIRQQKIESQVEQKSVPTHP